MGKQIVWRTFSNGGHNGFFIWEIVEVVGDPGKRTRMFDKCRDGSYIMINCQHTWNFKTADKWLFDSSYSEWQEARIITGMPELTEIEYREFISQRGNEDGHV